MKMGSIEKILTDISNLPTLPTVYTSLSEAMENPRTSTDSLAKIISTDQASSFKILKIVNSPFYGFRGKIDTISQAIIYLGFNEVRNIIFALSIISAFSKDKNLKQFSPVDFWAHSIAVGIATRMIGIAIGEKNIENFFLGGVFHDIGKLIFFEYAAADYLKVISIVNSKNCSIKDAEKEVFGIDHSKAGQIVSEKWKLPISIQNVIYYHHQGQVKKENNSLVAAVHVADIVARILELGYAGDDLIPEPNIKVWDVLKLNNGYFQTLKNKLIQDFDHTVRLMLID